MKDLHSLPLATQLLLLRDLDRRTNCIADDLRTSEKKLLEELDTQAKEGPDFDETPFKDKFQELLIKRQSLLALHEEQIRSSQACYDNVDNLIKSIGTAESLTLEFNAM